MTNQKNERVKNPHPAETPVQIKKRIKAERSVTLAARAESRDKAGSSGSASALSSSPGARKSTTKKAAAKKAPAKSAEKAADSK